MAAEEKQKSLKVVLQGMIGGFLGMVVFFLLVGGVFMIIVIIDNFSRVKIDCVLGRETVRGGVKCQILEKKDRGIILKTSERVSLPKDKIELSTIPDKTTSGKFIEVKLRLENLGKKTQFIGGVFLIDEKGREYSALSDLEFDYSSSSYTVNTFNWVIDPGLKKEFSKIFEVPKDVINFKIRVETWKGNRVD